MEELKARYQNCTLCSRCLNKTKVFGAGNLSASIAVIGESPSKEEVTTTTPFVGDAGKLLDGILAAIDLVRDDLFFTNSMLCRTDDKNRSPTREEYRNCRNRLFEELSIVKPRFTLLLGRTAICSVMGIEDKKLSETHGKWFSLLNEPCYFYYSIYHPSWILHAATDGEMKIRKNVMWSDIKRFRDEMMSLDEIYDNPGEQVETQRKCGKSPFYQILP